MFFFYYFIFILWLDVDKLYDVLIKSINYVDKFVFQFVMIFVYWLNVIINFNVCVDSVVEIWFMSIKWSLILKYLLILMEKLFRNFRIFLIKFIYWKFLSIEFVDIQFCCFLMFKYIYSKKTPLVIPINIQMHLQLIICLFSFQLQFNYNFY